MTRKAATFVALSWLLMTSPAVAGGRLKDRIDAYVGQHRRTIVTELADFAALPNVAVNKPDMDANARHLEGMLARRGFTTRRLHAAGEAFPSLFAELAAPGASRTIIFYAHFDGQPVQQEGWRSPPFKPILRDPDGVDVDMTARAMEPDNRLYGRSTSDDKGPIVGILAAIDALNAIGVARRVNVKLFLDGQEEQGSPQLKRMMAEQAALLKGDLWLLCDGPSHPAGTQQIYLGARGAMTLELTSFGPIRSLHSGHYGNWAPNPATSLVHLLSQLRDEEGRVAVPGFYDQVEAPSVEEKAWMAALPPIETSLRRELALGRTEGSNRLADSLMRPSLNIRGIKVGSVGDDAANVIPSEARASIDIRLVPNQDPEKVRHDIDRFFRTLGWHVVENAPDAGLLRSHPKVLRANWSILYPGYRGDARNGIIAQAVDVIRSAVDGELLIIPMLGGSIPMGILSGAGRIPVLGVPTVNADNSQHAANENLKLGNLYASIGIFAALMVEMDAEGGR